MMYYRTRCLRAVLIAGVAVLLARELRAQSSTPALSSISPNIAQVGSPSITITLAGSGFNSSSVVRLNGESLPTTLVDTSTLRSLIPNTRMTTSAYLSVAVFNSDTSQTSQAIVYPVYSTSPPTATSIVPGFFLRGTTTPVALSGTNLVGANLIFSGPGISAVVSSGTPTSLSLLVSIASDAPLGPQVPTISTPSGSTSTCGSQACSVSVVDSGSWTVVTPFHDVRENAPIVKLLDGRVLIAGGASSSGSVTASAEIFDPATGLWSPTGSMNLARTQASACLLPDGRVLVAGGFNGSYLSSAEIYDPAAGTWSLTGFMSKSGSFELLLLTNGKVLVSDGEVFDPISGQFQPTPGFPANGVAETLLTDGRVLLAVNSASSGQGIGIYDPATAKFSVGPPQIYITGAWLRLLPDGRVLVRSYYDNGIGFAGGSGYMYSATTNNVRVLGNANEGADVLLTSGLVLIAGGNEAYGRYATYEVPILYDPLADQVIPDPDMPLHFSTNSEFAFGLDDGRALFVGANGTLQPDTFAELYTPASYSNPAPVMNSVSSSNPVSNVDFITLDIRGAAFLPNSLVTIGQTRLVTIYLGSQRLVSFVPPQLRASLGSVGVAVTNPAPAGGSSGPVTAGFVAPPPQPPAIASMNPSTAILGSQFTATVSGQNLGNPTSVTFSGTGVTATFITANSDSNNLRLSVNVATGTLTGARSFTVVTAAGTATLQSALVIQRAAAPATPPLPIPEVETGAIRSGYVVITPDSSNVTPLATLTYGMVSGGIVQSQAAILPTSQTTDSSVPVDVVPAIGRNLGLAIANPNTTAATITLTLRNEDGTAVGSPAPVSINATGQLARFVTELFAGSVIGSAFRGSVEVQSSVAVSFTGLRFSGIEFSTVPIVANGPSGSSGSVIFPQFAMSGGWATALNLVNTTSNTISGRIDVFDTSGNPMTVKLNGSSLSTFTYSIPAKGSFTLAPRDANGQSPF
jgi:hypothetical protein